MNISQAEEQYSFQEELGQGAMGKILSAKDKVLKRKVAFKQIHAHIAENKQNLSRFLREMQITAQLEHPNIIPVYEFSATGGDSLAYSMKLIKGETLNDIIQNKRNGLDSGEKLSEEYRREQLLEYFLNICDAVYFAHTKGVIHRDLKPSNIMIGPYNEVYVMDWGIARLMGKYKTSPEEESNHIDLSAFEGQISLDATCAGKILGTPRYMSPQQAAGKNHFLDGRSDQFSLGLIMFELLTLTPGFTGNTPVELIKSILKCDLEPFTSYKNDKALPRELKAITEKALDLNPRGRYDTVAELAEDIRRYLRGLEVKAQPDTSFQKLIRGMGNHRLASLCAITGVFIISFLSIFLSLYNQRLALAAAKAKEIQFNQLFSKVSAQAQYIDTHFLEMAGLLKSIKSATLQSLIQTPKSNTPFYINHPFTAPDQVNSPLIGNKMSLTYPTVGFSPNKSLKDMPNKLPKILPLRYQLKHAVLKSSVDQPGKLTKEEIKKLISVEGTPITYSHISLEEGVIYYFPGTGYQTKGYDARKRPFYTLSAHKLGVNWGSPYFDPMTGAMFPSTTALYDPEGTFLGVAGIDLRFGYITQDLMKLKESHNIIQTYLLNSKGEVMISSSDTQTKKEKGSLTESFKTPLFHSPNILKAVKEKASGGYIEVALNEDKTKEWKPIASGESSQNILLYARLNTLGWYFVVEANILEEQT